MNKGATLFLVILVVAVIGYVVWMQMQQGNVGGLTFAQAGAQKQEAVSAASASGATGSAT